MHKADSISTVDKRVTKTKERPIARLARASARCVHHMLIPCMGLMHGRTQHTSVVTESVRPVIQTRCSGAHVVHSSTVLIIESAPIHQRGRWSQTECDVTGPGEGSQHREMLCRCFLWSCPRIQGPIRPRRVVHPSPSGCGVDVRDAAAGCVHLEHFFHDRKDGV